MMQRNDPPPEPIVNVAELLARVDNDAKLLRELIAIFKIDFPRHLFALREAIGQGNLKNVQKSGHTLRGMLSNLGATRAAAAAARLEQLGDSSDGNVLKSALALFETEVTGLLPELEACVAKARP
jgi:HPt (histidine-containing phosphotransfer) domain-containing protein